MFFARRLSAFVAAPLVGTVVFYAVWLFGRGGLALAVFLPFFWAPAVVGLIAELVLGIPVLVWLSRRKRLSLASFGLGGLAIGFVILLVLNPDPVAGMPSLVGITACLLSSIVASITFGYVGGWSSNDPLERTGSAGR